jgi:hypothetical protein
LLVKAKNVAMKFERFNLLLELFVREQRLAEFLRFIDAEKILKYEAGIIEKIRNTHQFHRLSTRLDAIITRSSNLRNEQDQAEWEAVHSHPLLASENNAITFHSRLNFYNIRGIYHAYTGAMEESFCYFKKVLEMLDMREEMIHDLMGCYIRSSHNYVNIAAQLNRWDEFSSAITSLKNRLEKEKSLNKKLLVLSSTFYNELSWYIKTGNFSKAVDTVAGIEKMISEHEQKIEKNFLLQFYYYFAVTWLGVNDLKKALLWVNRLIETPDRETYSDLQGFARILRMIVCFELEYDELITSSTVSAYRFFRKRKLLYRPEEAVLWFIRKKLPRIPTAEKEETIAAFRELRDELAELYRDPLAQNFMKGFDLIAWLDSKINNRSFADMVRENYQKGYIK